MDCPPAYPNAMPPHSPGTLQQYYGDYVHIRLKY